MNSTAVFDIEKQVKSRDLLEFRKKVQVARGLVDANPSDAERNYEYERGMLELIRNSTYWIGEAPEHEEMHDCIFADMGLSNPYRSTQ